jgi:hypothetical protein
MPKTQAKVHLYLTETARIPHYMNGETREVTRVRMSLNEAFGANPESCFEFLISNPDTAEAFQNIPINTRLEVLIRPEQTEE